MSLREVIETQLKKDPFCNLVLYDYENNIQERLKHCYIFDDCLFFDPITVGSGMKFNHHELIDLEDYTLLNITVFPTSVFLFYSHII